jgi:hypothetical protein
MNALENYKSTLEKYFGVGTSTFPTTCETANNVIGALHNSQFDAFRTAFERRLERLAAYYPLANPNRKALLVSANEIANQTNWQGAYAEMVAFDFLNSNQDYLPGSIHISKTVPARETLASGLGMQNVNFDGYFDEFNVCFDVKVLQDKSRQILDGIINEAKTALGIDVSMSPEYPLDLDYELFQRHRQNLLAELKCAINSRKQTKFVKSTIIPELSYRIMWGSGVLSAIGTYDTYLHAKNHHGLLFAHIKKFSKNSPSIIVFVVFPWFSESLLSLGISQPDFHNNEIFYRAFCRRFFCQYAKDSSLATAFLKSFTGTETISEVTDKLSGVLFLEDNSILSSDPDLQNVNGFAYLNPNAAHKASRGFRGYLSSLGISVDDFDHDNY